MIGIVFDMNGVIVDDERLHQQSWREYARLHALNLSEEDFKHKIFGRTEKETFEFLLNRKISEDELEVLSDERVSIVKELAEGKLILTEGLITLLTDLKLQAIPMAIATSSRGKYAQYILNKFEIGNFFSVVVTAQDIKKGKPDPEIYLKAAELLHISALNCVAIEDSLSGIRSAKSAGMKVVGIATTHAAAELDQADTVISSFNEITVSQLKTI